jgi:hypothetical protein
VWLALELAAVRPFDLLEKALPKNPSVELNWVVLGRKRRIIWMRRTAVRIRNVHAVSRCGINGIGWSCAQGR